jgi:hypothetical protein
MRHAGTVAVILPRCDRHCQGITRRYSLTLPSPTPGPFFSFMDASPFSLSQEPLTHPPWHDRPPPDGHPPRDHFPHDGHDHPWRPPRCSHNIEADEVFSLRVTAIFVIFATSTLATLIPILAARARRRGLHPFILEFFKYFGSGVIISTVRKSTSHV